MDGVEAGGLDLFSGGEGRSARQRLFLVHKCLYSSTHRGLDLLLVITDFGLSHWPSACTH